MSEGREGVSNQVREGGRGRGGGGREGRGREKEGARERERDERVNNRVREERYIPSCMVSMGI